MTTPALADHERRLSTELQLVNLPGRSWLPHSEEFDHDVIVVGAGMLGLTAAAALKMLGIARVRLFDRAAKGQEGPWVTYARMRDLRTTKLATGPALGIPALTFRAWYEAQFGAAAFEAMPRVPREVWMDYLNWYREVLALDVVNDTAVTALVPEGEGVAVSLSTGERLRARRVILATGLDGLGAPAVPAILRGLPKTLWAHSAEEIDFARLASKRVGVLGVGASAMDNAATALETGAGEVHLFVRKPEIPPRDLFTGISSPGSVHGFVGLPDSWKWRFLQRGNTARVPPPLHSLERVKQHPNAHLHLASPIEALSVEGDSLQLRTPKGLYTLDYLICATGFAIDYAARPELASIAPAIKLWSDALTPPEGFEDAELGLSPYLGPAFELIERSPGACPGLSRIHAFSYPAVLTHGKLTSGVPSVSPAAQRMAQGIVASLFHDNRAALFQQFVSYDVDEVPPGTWTDPEI